MTPSFASNGSSEFFVFLFAVLQSVVVAVTVPFDTWFAVEVRSSLGAVGVTRLGARRLSFEDSGVEFPGVGREVPGCDIPTVTAFVVVGCVE